AFRRICFGVTEATVAADRGRKSYGRCAIRRLRRLPVESERFRIAFEGAGVRSAAGDAAYVIGKCVSPDYLARRKVRRVLAVPSGGRGLVPPAGVGDEQRQAGRA